MLEMLVGEISNFMYGKLLIVMLLGVGLYYTLRTRFIQVRLFGETLKVIMEKKDDKQSVSSFQALMASFANWSDCSRGSVSSPAIRTKAPLPLAGSPMPSTL